MTKTVANRSAASTAMQVAAAKGRALMGGTTAMRKEKTRYLPKFGKESEAAYEARLNSSWLFNGYRKTVRDMTGRVFSKPVEVEDTPSQIEEWLKNADLQGRDLSTFARQVFEDALEGPGISYIMVDAPPRQGTVTQAQAQAQNLRPYLIHIRVEDVLGWKTEVINNVTTLTQIRLHEEYRIADPTDEFAEICKPQVRVLDRMDGAGVMSRIFRKGERDEWAEVPELASVYDVPEITIVPVYINRTGFFTGAPLLDDLADINIAHWQSQSDQRNILHFARVPVLFAAGVPKDAIGVIGGNTAVVADNAEAKMQWVEHSGKAIEAGRQDLKDLEFQMETFGLQLLTARPGSQSATGEALDANKETSILAMTADQLKDALEQAIAWMGFYGGVEVDPSVMVNKDFGTTMMTAQEASVLLQMVKEGEISRETFLGELKRRAFIRSDIDSEEELERIDEEDVAETVTEPPALETA